MRSRDPRILVYAKRSLCQTILLSLLFIDIFVLYACLLERLAWRRFRLYSWEQGFQRYCQKNLSDWGDYCRQVAKKRLKNTYHLLFNHVLVFGIIVFVISRVCVELIFELQARSREFCRWYRNSYRLNSRRHNS